ncbi:hypothetical protein BpHYR1_014293 [Brachionus plicatilis]|uniref:Uncharacterized protein n=1 Tax=Brachionus plicatilis TaxID=10195 RepID=A0A3M7R643_BRAPC|nr:hypothetical protein BpHYR1_014293 [Brachionus plicatilis]
MALENGLIGNGKSFDFFYLIHSASNSIAIPVDMDETADTTNVTADTSFSTVMTVHKAFDPNAISDSEDDTSGSEGPAAKKKKTRRGHGLYYDKLEISSYTPFHSRSRTSLWERNESLVLLKKLPRLFDEGNILVKSLSLNIKINI